MFGLFGRPTDIPQVDYRYVLKQNPADVLRDKRLDPIIIEKVILLQNIFGSILKQQHCHVVLDFGSFNRNA